MVRSSKQMNLLPPEASPTVRQRLEEIASLDLLSPEVQSELSDIVEATAERFGVPISLVTLLLNDAQRFAASCGLSGWLDEVKGTPIEWSFCAHAVRTGRAFIVEDAATHPATRENPLVRNDDLACYAGVPLLTSRGTPIGTLCVIDHGARHFEEDELEDLKNLGDEAMRRIEQRAAGGRR
jgi:GAF domain-containing protein